MNFLEENSSVIISLFRIILFIMNSIQDLYKVVIKSRVVKVGVGIIR